MIIIDFRHHITASKPTSSHPSLNPSQILLFFSPNVLPVGADDVIELIEGGCGMGWGWMRWMLAGCRAGEEPGARAEFEMQGVLFVCVRSAGFETTTRIVVCTQTTRKQ